MAFNKICGYEPCSKPFSCPGSGQRFCTVSCGNQARSLVSAEDVKAYFLNNVIMPESSEGCWIWNGSLNDGGYGMAFVRNGKIRAHRLAYEIFKGDIQEGMHILHGNTCTTRSCVNPDHVRVGTNFENMQDKKEWGDQRRGSRHYLAEHSEIQALHILQEFHEDGMTMSEIADKRGEPIVTIHDIIHRKTWRHVAPGQYPAPHDQRAIVDKDIVREMRQFREHHNMSYQDIASKFNLKYPTVVDICTYRTWKKVTI